jgi:TatA/E family protein of Tat protein translocase
MSSFSIWHWIIVLIVVILIFGTKSFGSAGGNVDAAVRNFREAMSSKEHATLATWLKLAVASALLVYIVVTIADLAAR